MMTSTRWSLGAAVLVVTATLAGACSSNGGVEPDQCEAARSIAQALADSTGTSEELLIATVFFTGTVTDDDLAFLESLGVQIVYVWKGQPFVTVRMPPDALQIVEEHSRVQSVSLSKTYNVDGC